MKFIYLIAAYNENEILNSLIDKFRILIRRNINFEVYIIDNASTDKSKETLDKLTSQNPWLYPIYIKEKGLGVAFKKGLEFINTKNLSSDDWIVFSAADLPFNFSDLDAFLRLSNENQNCELFLGSKYHLDSRITRSFNRLMGSYIFYFLRLLILQLNVKDTQGTVFLKAKYISTGKKVEAQDYFFTTELIYYMKALTPIIEMPIIYEPSSRPSKVNLLVDGFKSLKQLIRLRLKSSRS